MPFLDLPFETFGDLNNHGLQVPGRPPEVWQVRIVDNRAEALRDQDGTLCAACVPKT